jgi:FkbM family methyltransferase
LTLHGDATVLSDVPLCVSTPATAWSYAASFAVEGSVDVKVVAELVVRVRKGSAGVSYVDRDGQNLRHEVMVTAATTPFRVYQVIEPDDRGLLMIRTGGSDDPAHVEIRALDLRPASADELAAADARPVVEPLPGWSAFYGDHAVSVAQQIRSLRFRRLPRETRREWIEGLSVIISPREQISRAVYVSGLYEPDTTMVLRSWLVPGATFLDIGANIGLFTLLASRWVGASGRVIAVEPSPRERERLAAHLRLNGIRHVDVVAAAVADREGSGELMVAADEHSGLNTLARRFSYSGVNVAETVAVPLVTLDSLAAATALTRVDVIKLDIEGSEYAALRGAATVLSRFRPRLIIEVVPDALSAAGASIGELQELLDHAGYQLFEIGDRGTLRRIQRIQDLYDGNLAALPRELSEV